MRFICEVRELIGCLNVVGSADVRAGHPATVALEAATGRVSLWTWGEEVSAKALLVTAVEEPGTVLLPRMTLRGWASAIGGLKDRSVSVTLGPTGVTFDVDQGKSVIKVPTVMGEINAFPEPEGTPLPTPEELWEGAWRVAFAGQREAGGSPADTMKHAIHVTDGAVWATDGYRLAVYELDTEAEVMLPISAGRLRSVIRDAPTLSAVKDGLGRLHVWNGSAHFILSTILPTRMDEENADKELQSGYISWRKTTTVNGVTLWDAASVAVTLDRKELRAAIVGLMTVSGSGIHYLRIAVDDVIGTAVLEMENWKDKGIDASWTLDAQATDTVEFAVNPHYLIELLGEAEEDEEGLCTFYVTPGGKGAVVYRDGPFATLLLPMVIPRRQINPAA